MDGYWERSAAPNDPWVTLSSALNDKASLNLPAMTQPPEEVDREGEATVL